MAQVRNVIKSYTGTSDYSINDPRGLILILSTLTGKSAVVAAVQLCLGATAKNTGRGSNLQGLIREGSDGPAVMRITLLNEGDDAYKPDIYGNRITVERRIVKNGGGGYKLLCCKGNVSNFILTVRLFPRQS